MAEKDRKEEAPEWVKKRRKIGVAKRLVARAMKKAGHSFRQISEALDISVGALNYIVREGGPECDTLAHEIEVRNASRHRILAEHILSSIDDEDIRRAPLKQKVIAAAILTDKAEMIEKRQSERKGLAAWMSVGGEPRSEQDIERDQRRNSRLFSRAFGRYGAE